MNYGDEFQIKIQHSNETTTSDEFLLESCAKYTFLIFYNEAIEQIDYVLLIDLYPNGFSVLWQLIQILIMTIGEIMFFITGLNFAYNEAPPSMKSVIRHFTGKL